MREVNSREPMDGGFPDFLNPGNLRDDSPGRFFLDFFFSLFFFPSSPPWWEFRFQRVDK